MPNKQKNYKYTMDLMPKLDNFGLLRLHTYHIIEKSYINTANDSILRLTRRCLSVTLAQNVLNQTIKPNIKYKRSSIN